MLLKDYNRRLSRLTYSINLANNQVQLEEELHLITVHPIHSPNS